MILKDFMVKKRKLVSTYIWSECVFVQLVVFKIGIFNKAYRLCSLLAIKDFQAEWWSMY